MTGQDNRYEAQIKDIAIWAGTARIEVEVVDHQEQDVFYLNLYFQRPEAISMLRKMIRLHDLETLEARAQRFLF